MKIKPFYKFSKNMHCSFSLQSHCKDCGKIKMHKWRMKNPKYAHNWYKRKRKEILKKLASIISKTKEKEPIIIFREIMV